MESFGDINSLLESLAGSDLNARTQTSEQLFMLIYDELYKLAQDRMRHERPGHTLQPTALVNEVYLRLVSANLQREWDNTGHFFAAAARAMRQILIDHVRRKLAQKRSIDGQRVDLQVDEGPYVIDDSSLVELHEAITELEQHDPIKAQLVELRFFAGLNIEQICQVLKISRATANRYWKQARAWLFLRISESQK